MQEVVCRGKKTSPGKTHGIKVSSCYNAPGDFSCQFRGTELKSQKFFPSPARNWWNGWLKWSALFLSPWRRPSIQERPGLCLVQSTLAMFLGHSTSFSAFLLPSLPPSLLSLSSSPSPPSHFIHSFILSDYHVLA